MGVNVVQIRTNLADYRDKEGLWGRKFIWEGVDMMSPILWWRSLRGTSELVEVAIRILGAPVTSAATERTFSAFSWIHSKKRNRLTSQRAAKLTYLSYNWKLLNPKASAKTNLETTTLKSPDISLSLETRENSQEKGKRQKQKKADSEEKEELEDEESSTSSHSDIELGTLSDDPESGDLWDDDES